MKAVFIFVTAFLILVFSACNKKKYPDSVINPDSIFYFKANVNNTPVSFGAGTNDYYMYSSYSRDSNNVYNFTGTLKQTNCGGNCANSVSFLIHDSKVSAANTVANPDSAFQAKTYPYNNLPVIGYAVQFQSTYNRTAANYLWNFGDGNTSNLPNPTHSYIKSGNYNVCLTVNGTNGCSGSICNIQKVGLPGNPCRAAITTANANGNTINFTQSSSGQGNLTYLWDFGDGAISKLANPIHTYSIPGSYPVSLRVIDGNNDVALASYNTLTQFDGSSCATNYAVVSTTPVSPSYLNLSTVGFTWTDASGSIYTASNIQPGSSYFQIISSEDYHANENGQKTKKIHVKFKCDMTNGINTITIDNAEAVICVAYQ